MNVAPSLKHHAFNTPSFPDHQKLTAHAVKQCREAVQDTHSIDYIQSSIKWSSGCLQRFRPAIPLLVQMQVELRVYGTLMKYTRMQCFSFWHAVIAGKSERVKLSNTVALYKYSHDGT